ncbi:MAG: BolA family transcriptional regulator [Candidatus Omnitrophica bacterium]|nr:BolA family transcriptional regulator [Candidatus Omnitrophota bacterium]
MKQIITQLLQEQLKPTLLTIEDDSAKHADHNPAAASGGTHFDVTIVSEEFYGKSRVQRHRMIYKILDNQIKQQIHALAITALTPQEHQKSG